VLHFEEKLEAIGDCTKQITNNHRKHFYKKQEEFGKSNI
jgi:hypothetical protein